MISGKDLKYGIISAANNIANRRIEINSINIFPVPDGDTGSNMFVTLEAAKKGLLRLSDGCTVSEAAGTAAHAMLRASRGNSGAILTLLFRGFARSLDGIENAGALELTEALIAASGAAYRSVIKPAEGTMLTTARLGATSCAELLKREPETDVAGLFQNLVRSAQSSLEESPRRMEVLREAGLVDSGAMGLLLVYEGMSSVFSGQGIIERRDNVDEPGAFVYMEKSALSPGDDSALGYTMSFTFISDFEEKYCRESLSPFSEGCVAVKTGNMVRCRLLSGDPAKILSLASGLGEILLFNASAHTACCKVSFPDPCAGPGSVKLPKNLFPPIGKNIYCTELSLLKDAQGESAEQFMRGFLSSIGDSVVVIEGDDMVKCHVHTADPAAVFSVPFPTGYISELKIENMSCQAGK